MRAPLHASTRRRWSSCRPTTCVRASSGTLVDFNANPLDVTATIIDLAVRGYLKIEELDKEWYQRKHDWKLTQARPRTTASSSRYERTLYDGLFRDGDEVQALRPPQQVRRAA